jgi:hypothetical protein
MPDLKIEKHLWEELVSVAGRRKQKPETLARQVLRDYIQQVSDEELLERSAAAARKAPFRMAETEEVIRQYRRKKAGRDHAG